MVVFAGLLTIVLLKRSLHLHHWMGIILIVAGAAMVGASRSEAFAHSYFSEGLFEVYVCAWRQTQCHSYSYENKLCHSIIYDNGALSLSGVRRLLYQDVSSQAPT